MPAPLFVDPLSGLNDDLNGVERPVSFGIKEQNEKEAQVVHSLAKWKRYALGKYGDISSSVIIFRLSSPFNSANTFSSVS